MNLKQEHNLLAKNQSLHNKRSKMTSTDEIGQILEKEYGKEPPNTPIIHFYLRLGREVLGKINNLQLYSTLDDILKGANLCGKSIIQPGWQGLVIFKFDTHCSTNECDREVELNEKVRKPLIWELSKLAQAKAPIHVLLSRACLYTPSSRKTSVTESDMMEMTKRTNTLDLKNAPISNFYLFIQAQVKGEWIDVNDKAFWILETLQGEWKILEPQSNWQGIFFGFYPNLSISEREREISINDKVRLPLIAKLKEHLSLAGSPTPVVQVIITRACSYTL